MGGIKTNRPILWGLSVIEAGYVRREANGRQYFLTTRILQISTGFLKAA
ncbi:hypothetical protein K1W69_22960 [Hoeflea sp. WL0058]|uniref:Uncharacterized protein n=1 Tax=Flavimaribacter sediminis TaxID=2865987 RepID=A0AAE3D3V9_9HYPH|nr:hypothetical protein [Flavimaribacter sediminis]MBW8640073.1 hypothetical protein [Flavimaribacter sediminis]